MSLLFFLLTLLTMPEPELKLFQPVSQNDQYRSPGQSFPPATRLEQNGFEIVKQTKRVRLPDSPHPVTVSYATVTQNGKTLARFDGVYHAMGNATEFGWFPMLASKNPQLIVSQTVPRGGRHWVVSFSPRFQIVFDSREFGLHSEEFQVVDLDHDGIYEISLRHQGFWGFHGLTMAESPLPDIIFRYEANAGKYLPANPRFQSHLLPDLAKVKQELLSRSGEPALAPKLGTLLTCLFAGKEQIGWDFFEQAYDCPDRPQVKAKIKAILQKDPVWRFLQTSKVRVD